MSNWYDDDHYGCDPGCVINHLRDDDFPAQTESRPDQTFEDWRSDAVDDEDPRYTHYAPCPYNDTTDLIPVGEVGCLCAEARSSHSDDHPISLERLADHIADVCSPGGDNWEGAAKGLEFLLFSDGYEIRRRSSHSDVSPDLRAAHRPWAGYDGIECTCGAQIGDDWWEHILAAPSAGADR